MSGRLDNLMQRIVNLKKEESELNKASKSLKDEREALETELMHLLEDLGAKNFESESVPFVARRITKQHVNIVDWESLRKSIMSQDLLHIMYSRVNGKAYKDAVEAGFEVEGVEIFEENKLQITKKAHR